MSICILCNNEKATTREHTFKADRYRERIGSIPSVYIRDGEKDKIIKSYKNNNLKPKINLCLKCNGTRSLRPDRVFSEFDEYIQNELDKKLDQGRREINIDVSNFFKDRDSLDYLHLTRYFAKYLSCQLNRYGYEVPEILRSIFMKGVGYKNLKVNVSGDGRFVRLNVISNNGIQVSMAGVPGNILIEEVKDGMFPEQIHTKIQYGPVIYELTLYIPNEEITNSAIRSMEATLYTTLKSKALSKSYLESISNKPQPERERLISRKTKKTIITFLAILYISKPIFWIYHKICGFRRRR